MTAVAISGSMAASQSIASAYSIAEVAVMPSSPYLRRRARAGVADPYAREREVLDLAAAVRVDPESSPAEKDRARSAVVRDRRLSVALETAGYGLTQTLAAAPQLSAR